MINRLKTEFAGLSKNKRIAYGVGLAAAIIIAALLLSGVWDPGAVETGVVPVK
ncbi:hypothetical protein [Arthrobacter caoxuetaonis]|uniref:Uncharacterized protein n=1 Tax=Arthrobacter caoxuetaonis TaxID=2886935 RepID=A0A9X1SE44_9MICC|nr:hypothetical protein [Arthrobacter caoxuetaonis]MCC3299246.1 hypothetical protein [Arthrobacter caoxuetaonis]USQ59260.1 hypothetical protein NF551_16890 [Arthrobacter caoxuetaonis]